MKVRKICQMLLAFTCLFAGLSSFSAYAVQGGAAADDSAPVSGVILDQAGLPVIGAFVLQKGTSNGTITDPDGKFTIEIPSDAVL